MDTFRTHRSFRTLAAVLVTLVLVGSVPGAWAASHREAPLISLDPAADTTDVYAFRSWEDPSKAVLIMNVIPSQVPASGPNFFNFDDDVVYAFNLDLDGDGNAEDVRIEFSFTTEIRAPFDDLPVAIAGVDTVPGLPPAVTALDGPGSAGLGLRQRYSVRAVSADGTLLGQTTTDKHGNTLFAVPSNVGARTMPNYEAWRARASSTSAAASASSPASARRPSTSTWRSAFDTLNFRRNPPVLTNAEDANDAVQPFGINDFEGLNVNTIAIELPISALPSVIGMYASTGRHFDRQVFQVSRLANPLVNELIIGTGSKDVWNTTDPTDEAQFLGFYQNPRLAAVLNLAFGIPVPATPRTDLVSVLLKYAGQNPAGCSGTNPCAELLRLDLGVPPRAPALQKRLTVLAHDAAGMPTPDPAGWPNGRRPNDDVTDIALRVVAGVLVPGPTAGFPHTRLGDGVNFNSGVPAGATNVTANGIATTFPFLPTPIAGRR